MRYVGKEYPQCRGGLYIVSQYSKDPWRKIQLGCYKNGYEIAVKPNGLAAWWVERAEVELVSSTAPKFLGFDSADLDAKQRDQHAHEAKEPRKVTLPKAAKTAPEATESRVTSETCETAVVMPETDKKASESATTSVWAFGVVNGGNSVIELYSTQSKAEARRFDIRSIVEKLGIGGIEMKVVRMEVR